MNALFVPRDTKATLLPLAIKDCSRSLYFDRYCRPDLAKDPRQQFFAAGFTAHTSTIKCASWAATLQRISADPIYAQLQSRFMVNMAGSVMENAGLCLDRFGLPYIPGSAVKGCARRAAIQSLLEQREAGAKPELLSRVLADIALVFGWGEQDWSDAKKGGRFTSDFAYAVGAPNWPGISFDAKTHLPDTSHFAGSISFLPSHPVDVAGAELPLRPPGLDALDLDVVTCHHPKYYQDPAKHPVATDDEDPNPVMFPAVAAGHVFAFTVLPMRNCTGDLLKQARRWLADGLSLFGLGAKTAAGYGWFDSSPTVNDAVQAALNSRADRELVEGRRKSEKEAEEKAEQERIAHKREQDKRMASMSEDEKADFEIDQMNDSQRLQWMEKIDQRNDSEKSAIYRLLQSRNTALWKELRQKAEQGKQKEKKRFGPVVQEMFKIAKQRKEKMS